MSSFVRVYTYSCARVCMCRYIYTYTRMRSLVDTRIQLYTRSQPHPPRACDPCHWRRARALSGQRMNMPSHAGVAGPTEARQASAGVERAHLCNREDRYARGDAIGSEMVVVAWDGKDLGSFLCHGQGHTVRTPADVSELRPPLLNPIAGYPNKDGTSMAVAGRYQHKTSTADTRTVPKEHKDGITQYDINASAAQVKPTSTTSTVQVKHLHEASNVRVQYECSTSMLLAKREYRSKSCPFAHRCTSSAMKDLYETTTMQERCQSYTRTAILT